MSQDQQGFNAPSDVVPQSKGEISKSKILREMFSDLMEESLMKGGLLSRISPLTNACTATITQGPPVSREKIVADIMEAKAHLDSMLFKTMVGMSALPASLQSPFQLRIPVPGLDTRHRIPLLPSIHVSPLLSVQYRFPVSKKHRIRKKWAKRPENFRPDRAVYMTEHGMFCHPSVERELRAAIVNAGVTS